MVRDPVCGMTVDPAKAAASVEHHHETYYFCAKGCAQKFAADPPRYLHVPSALLEKSPSGLIAINAVPIPAPSTAKKPSPDPGKIRYTCPMHPDVVQWGPGSCPKCGMALEPMDIVAEEIPDPEYDSMRKRFWISAALSLPVLMLACLAKRRGCIS